MKYTEEHLNAMIDLEINKLLTELLGFKVEKHSIVDIGSIWCVVGSDNGLNRLANYCTNWNDIMPLAVEHDIIYGRVICPAGSGAAYYAKQIDGDIITSYEPTPQRAIACCLILVLQDK
jgi:hypothetical protein